MWEYCSRNASDCDRMLSDYVAKSAAALRDQLRPLERSMIRVALRPAPYVENARKTFVRNADSELITELFAGDLWLICMADLPSASRVLNVADLRKLGLSKEEAIALGKQNLAASLRPLKSVVQPLPSNGIGTITGDYYESSRLSLHDDWSVLAAQMKGGLIVAVPSNDMVLYGDAAQPNAIDAMGALARDVSRRSQRPISATVFRWSKGGWEPVSP